MVNNSDGQTPRAYIQDELGIRTPVPDELISGFDDFGAGFTRDVGFPHSLHASGWQGSDEEHPISGGVPAYRFLYKTLGLIPYPSLDMHWPNMRIRFKNGPISFGGMTAADFLPGRNQRQVVLPQFGRVYDGVDPNPPFYITEKNPRIFELAAGSERSEQRTT